MGELLPRNEVLPTRAGLEAREQFPQFFWSSLWDRSLERAAVPYLAGRSPRLRVSVVSWPISPVERASSATAMPVL